MSSTACIKWIKIGSPSFKPTLIVGLLLASSLVDYTNPCIASLIFLALNLVIGPFGTYKESLRLGPPWFPSLCFLRASLQVATRLSTPCQQGALKERGNVKTVIPRPCLSLAWLNPGGTYLFILAFNM